MSLEWAEINKEYTYKDYLKFPDDKRVEIIEGRIYDMSPSPSRIHQKVVMELAFSIENYLRTSKMPCEVYIAPFDVIFIEENQEIEESKSIVQPDIFVVCDKAKLTERGCMGSPDLIIEVVSPNNSSHDYIRKLHLYNRFKVKEYWIVNPQTRDILVYRLNVEGEFGHPEYYTFSDKVKVRIFKDFEVDFNFIKDRLTQ
ncbi:Uma2 family endonuclease [Thermovenabulum gondwanense]|uniref:Putative restriction endonuclease domain-containing protein n=1 Tax=Thermovenabulum gondwanense TaxID=520767 RepID=A0A161PVJ0_9FIRM|nr:Uma2 family endonuclease [Thermovenabulum gondwanense]KYO66955.1 hypothetical protein ATZ99_07720 [Thermovenabulum gondwanense]